MRAYPPLPAARPAPAAQQAPKRRKVARRDEYSDESSEEDAEEDEPKKGRGSGRSSQKVTLRHSSSGVEAARLQCCTLGLRAGHLDKGSASHSLMKRLQISSRFMPPGMLDVMTALKAQGRCGKRTCIAAQVSYDDRGYGSEDDEEIERREKAAKQELVPAFMESQEGYDDEVERVLSHRCALLSSMRVVQGHIP